MPLGTTFAWIFFIAVLGVTMAIPMKRQMINIEQIRFPDSIATAETLKVLYSEGKRRRDRPKPFFILPFSPPLMPSPWLQEENDGLERSSNISSATGTSVLSSSNGISCSWVRELW